ncbi:hypothetical protein ACFT4A_31790 [Streptomyces sp. NPDC057099]|uniref:hypothetical protein n=1 Tax=Streptomyces sp. NPDC057099 TaxID=3346019 RepID=UPI0036393219
MAFTDHPDVFVGATDDAWTFVILNRRIPGAARMLTGAGFTARQHLGRTIYVLPPETAEDAHERAGVAVYGLMAHTMDLVDLAWTTRHHGPERAELDVSIRFADGTVTATAAKVASPGRDPRHSTRCRPGRVKTRHSALSSAPSPTSTPAA